MSDCEFPLTFAFTLGGCGYVAPEEWQAIEGTELAWIESHCDEGKQLLLWQFQGKPRLESLLCALLRAGVQELDDATWQVLTETLLDTAVGVNLELIGGLVDLPRKGWGDETYRQLLRAQIRVLKSKGGWPDLIRIMDRLGIDTSLVDVAVLPPAAARARLGEPLDGAIGKVETFDMLNRARSGGVRFDLEYPESPVDEALTWADADSTQADTDRGWADDSPVTFGGFWAGVSTTED